MPTSNERKILSSNEALKELTDQITVIGNEINVYTLKKTLIEHYKDSQMFGLKLTKYE